MSPPAAFWSAAAALAVTMAFSAAPTPLYPLYQDKWGFSTFTITVIYAVYAVGVIVGLVFGGHVSDWYGRRLILLPALLLNLLCAVGFLLEPPLAGLLAARTACGIAIGLTTATATAYIAELDLATGRPPATGRAPTVATVANVGGIGLGPLIAGFLAQYAPEPLRLPYLVFGLLLLTATVLIILSPETAPIPYPRPSYRPQRIAVPDETRRTFLATAALGFAAFSVYDVINSLVPTFLTISLNEHSHAVAGSVAFATFASGAAIQTWLIHLSPTAGTRIGPLLLIPGLTLLSVAIQTASLPLFLTAACLSGAGSGSLFRHALSTTATTAPPQARAEVLAGFFVGTYIGVSAPAVAMGVALHFSNAQTVMPYFAAAVILTVLLSLHGLRRANH